MQRDGGDGGDSSPRYSGAGLCVYLGKGFLDFLVKVPIRKARYFFSKISFPVLPVAAILRQCGGFGVPVGTITLGKF